MTESKVRIFVSSPSDVEHERVLVKDIIETLAQEYRPYFQLQAVLWEEEALTAARSFQAGLLRPSECEIVLVMLWTRLGTPLADDPYGGMTGTEWEFVDAVDASARHETPEVLVYRKIAPRLVDINNAETIRAAMTDRDRLEVFFRTHFFNPDGSFRRAFRQFDNDAAFRDLVETQLRKLLNRRISTERRFAAGSIEWRGSPFRALGPFDVGDERVFTGRETETRELVARLDGLRRGPGQGGSGKGQGLLLLTGPSGVGKTSLLRAGLLPHLVRPFLFSGIAGCRWCLVEPDPEDPLASLARALVSPSMLGTSLVAFGLDAERLTRLFASEPRVGADQIRAAIAQTINDDLQQTGGREGRLQLAVILDPLDGLFAEARLDSPRTQTFVDTLTALAAHEEIWIIAALGSRHLPGLTRFPALVALLDERSYFPLEPPALGRIRQVMEIPARVAGIEFEAMGRDSGHGLIEALESEASAVTHWPALLEQTLDALYRQRESSESTQGSLLTLRAYHRIGGLSGPLLKRADDLWQTLDEETRGALPMLCRTLLALEGGSHASAREGNLQTLLRDDRCATLTQRFIEARLIVADAVWDPAQRSLCPPIEMTIGDSLRHLLTQIREEWRARFKFGQTADSLDAFLDAPATEPADPEPSADPALQWEEYRPIADFAHPALFLLWGPVRDWLTNPDHRRDLTLRSQIARQARQWKRTDCNREYLLGEVGYAAARVFAQTHWQELEPLEREFLDRSWSGLQLQRRRNRRVIGSLLAVLMLFAGVTLYALWDASRQTLLNRQSGLLREAEIAIGRGNTPEAIRLALMAGPDLPEAGTDVISRALSSNRLLAMIQTGDTSAESPFVPQLSDDGEQLATVSNGSGAQLWIRQDGGFRHASDLAGPELPIHAIRFAGRGENRMILGIGATGVWRLPAQPEQPPDWSCGDIKETAIALDPEGRFLALAHKTPTDQFAVCVLDLSRPGAPLWDRPLHTAWTRSLAFSADGQRLMSASRDGLTRILDSKSGDEQLVLPRQGSQPQPAMRAVFSLDGQRIAVASLDELVRVYDLNGKQIAELGAIQRGARTIRIHQSAVRDLAFSPDGLSLVVGDGTGQVVRWDLRTHSAEIIGQHDLGVDQISISPNADPQRGEHLVLSVSQDRTARLWSLTTGRALAVFSHDKAISEARFSQDGRLIMTTAQADGSARLWSAEPANPLAFRLDHDDHVWHVAMAEAPAGWEPAAQDTPPLSSASPGARHATATRATLMATAAFDGHVEVWSHGRTNGTTNPVRFKSLAGHKGRVRRVDFSPSAQWLTSAGSDGTARLWSLNTANTCRLRVASQRKVCRTDGAADCPNVYRILFSPDERWLLTTSSDPDQPVRFWDPEDCTALPLPDVFTQMKGSVRDAAMTAAADDEVLLATGSEHGALQLMRRDRQGTWSRLCQWDAHQGSITELTFSPDGHWLAAASRDGRASLYRIGDGFADRPCGEPRYLDGQSGRLYSVQFAPDGKALVTASFEAKAHVWSLDGTLLAELNGHKNRVDFAQFSPDGRWILTASRDGAIRIWKRPLRAHAKPMGAYLTLDANLGSVTHAMFSPDGHAIGAGYWENAALLWRLWDEDPRPDRHLEGIWGRDRSRLQLIREALRFQKKFSIGVAEQPFPRIQK
ncbi:hypothetical protein CCR95_05875 [Thiocystis minor]|uniref:nSTAND1 domain-containing NTPase n=1 Tax=Thiocystis minor TaxID=61597 RepID=UPI001913738C|nr:hypothetical protein [Thiocystis minor]MBK5963626.1 hypothetical protein [Thiocystis minor]